MQIQIDFNRVLDHGFVQFGELEAVARVIPLAEAPDIALHLSAGGRLVGLELSRLDRRLGGADLAGFDPDALEDVLG